ncbi:MAG: cohesin domain-containing protein [bacterium]
MAGDSQWAIIVTNTPNDGSYTWKVPNTPSTQCLVRILDAADPAVADTSEGPFTILPLEVTLRIAGGSGSQGSVDNRVAIELENEASLGSLHFSLAYEPSVLAATNVVGTERTADMSRFWWDHSAPGSLSVTIDDGIVAAGVGPIAAVRFDVSGDGPPGGYPILLSDCALRDTLLKESFLCATEDGIFTVYPRPRFSIEGFVQDTRGDGLEGVTITLMGDTSAVFTTSATGYYQFTQLVGGDYVVLPSKACWTFQPPLRRYISLNGNYDDQNFVGITLGRSFLSWSDAVLEDELTDGALEDTFAVWFGPGLPCSLHAVEAAFGSPGTVMIFVWEAGPDAPNDGIAPARGSFSGRPLGDVVAGPIPFTVQGTGDWERLEFDQHGPVPVFGGPEEPGRSFFVGWVKVVPGLFPHNVPHALGSNLFPKATHSWFGGPWTLPGGPDPKDYRWGGYDTETDSTPNFEYAVRVDLSFPWCPSVVSLGLPETVGVEGETLSVPVYVYSVVSGLNIFSYACEIGFDETLLDVVGCVSQAGDMTRTWEEPVCETMTPGRVSVAQSGSSPLFGSGTLIHIRFRLLSSWRECSDLSFVSFSFNGGDPPVRSEDGRVCVEAGSQRCRISGYVLHYSNASPVAGATLVLSAGHSDTMSTDEAGFYLFDRLLCTLNDTVCATVTDYVSRGVTAYDAALVAQAAVGLRTLSPLQRVAGDASANCAVSAYDAALIAQRAAGLIFSLPAGPWVLIPEKVTVTQENWCTAPSCLTHTPLAMDRDGQDFVAVPVGDVSGNWSPTQGAMKRSWPVELFQNVTAHCGQGLTLPIFVGDDKGIVAVDLTFTYDPAVLCLDSVSQTDATKNFTMVLNPLPGCAQVCLFGPTSSGEKGPLLELKFTVIGERGDVSPLNVSRLLINEKPLTVAEAWLTVTGEAPETYWLEQNAPNPFNPSTSIQYSVVSDQSPTTSSQYSVVSEQFLPHVTLKIYNLLGQEVRTLVDEPKEPGYYSAVWDGRDEKGDKVSSGIYFYRLSMGSFVQTRRMVLLR